MNTGIDRELKRSNGAIALWSGPAAPIPQHSNTPALHRLFAFTLIELLVVIAIIGMLAGLVLHLGPGINDAKTRKTVNAQLEQLTLVIEHYKEVKGFYPPSNPNGTPDNAYLNTLYYELTGNDLPSGVDKSALGAAGIVNIQGSSTDSKNFFPNVKENQWYDVNTLGGARLLGIKMQSPEDGPAGIANFCPWFYRVAQEGDPNAHNAGAFDLWVKVKTSKGTTVLGNWKKD